MRNGYRHRCFGLPLCLVQRHSASESRPLLPSPTGVLWLTSIVLNGLVRTGSIGTTKFLHTAHIGLVARLLGLGPLVFLHARSLSQKPQAVKNFSREKFALNLEKSSAMMLATLNRCSCSLMVSPRSVTTVRKLDAIASKCLLVMRPSYQIFPYLSRDQRNGLDWRASCPDLLILQYIVKS